MTADWCGNASQKCREREAHRQGHGSRSSRRVTLVQVIGSFFGAGSPAKGQNLKIAVAHGPRALSCRVEPAS